MVVIPGEAQRRPGIHGFPIASHRTTIYEVPRHETV